LKRRSWTFLYVPEGEGGVRTYRVSKRLTRAFLALVGVGALGMGGLVANYIRQEHVLHDVREREEEITSLRARIAEFEEMASDYEEAMDQARQLREQANLIAGLGSVGDAFGGVGLGGEENPGAVQDLSPAEDLNRSRLRELHLQLDRLLREARYERENYAQVVETLREDQELRDSTPSIRPVNGGYLSSRFGRRIDPFTGRPAFHRGLDFSARIGTAVHAPAAGQVTRASRKGSLGQLIEVDHGNGTVTRYGHLDQFLVKKGDWVRRGQVIGRVGTSGRSTGPHLHYEVVQSGQWQNPWLYIVRN
jgi:murein DD-endopeptidase MepM/ murein hydrolase activator NlpD